LFCGASIVVKKTFKHASISAGSVRHHDAALQAAGSSARRRAMRMMVFAKAAAGGAQGASTP